LENLISNLTLGASKTPGYEVLNYQTDIKIRALKHMADTFMNFNYFEPSYLLNQL